MADKKQHKPVLKHEEEYLHYIMKQFDIWATLFGILFLFFFLFTYNLLPEWTSVEPQETAVLEENPEDDPNRIENGIHVRSGLIVDKDYELVVNHCGACHSYKLVTQNKADAAGWTSTIRWMQKTQKLWDLGKDEAKIVAYLAKNYGSKKATRRENLKDIDWYEL